jgi:hypothetical protein
MFHNKKDGFLANFARNLRSRAGNADRVLRNHGDIPRYPVGIPGYQGGIPGNAGGILRYLASIPGNLAGIPGKLLRIPAKLPGIPVCFFDIMRIIAANQRFKINYYHSFSINNHY